MPLASSMCVLLEFQFSIHLWLWPEKEANDHAWTLLVSSRAMAPPWAVNQHSCDDVLFVAFLPYTHVDFREKKHRQHIFKINQFFSRVSPLKTSTEESPVNYIQEWTPQGPAKGQLEMGKAQEIMADWEDGLWWPRLFWLYSLLDGWC